MKDIGNVVVVIPALNPDEKLLSIIKNLKEEGFRDFILVNDGSDVEFDDIFIQAESLGNVMVIRHNINMGKGRALKTALNQYLGGGYPEAVGIVECDADGQHTAEDVVRAAELLMEYPDNLVLGVRNFNVPGIPFRSRFGNKCTSLIFRFFCGMNIRDTQTGLKAIPDKLIPALIMAPGERYEYDTSMLLEVQKQHIPIRQFDIQTIYIQNNASSHFNPLRDSIRIYSLLLKYILSSLASAAIDIFVFAVMMDCVGNNYVFVANAVAHIASIVFNFLFNRKVVFGSSGGMLGEITRYIILSLGHIIVSSALILALRKIVPLPDVAIKMIVDTCLFFLVYYIQRTWVFASKNEDGGK